MEFSRSALPLTQTELRLAYLASQGLLTSPQFARVQEFTQGAELPTYGAGSTVGMDGAMNMAAHHQAENTDRLTGMYL